MMEGINLLNLTIGVAGIMLCGLGILQVTVGTKVDKRTERYFILFYACLILFATSNLTGQLLRGHPGMAARAGLYVSNFCEFSASSLLAYIVTTHLLSIVDPTLQKKPLRCVILILFLSHIFAVIVSQFTGLFYTIDADNVYQRSTLYPLSYLTTGIMMLLDLYLLCHDRDKLTRKERIAFWTYIIIPLIAMLVQIFVYGVYFVVFAAVIGALVIYIFIASDQTERYYRQEQENVRLTVNLMLSQIQPHFLYNSLWVIQELCRTDPAKAEQAISQFSRYLRHNMDSLTTNEMILFSEELEHTRTYVALQKLRFGDDLKVEYDLSCTVFSLPTLTLQPIVENAITHGVRHNEDGRGIVIVRTRETEGHYEVIVTDDGPGFVPDVLSNDRKTHIGIQNVRSRLKRICGGELNIESKPDEGSTVTILIPKNKGDNLC